MCLWGFRLSFGVGILICFTSGTIHMMLLVAFEPMCGPEESLASLPDHSKQDDVTEQACGHPEPPGQPQSCYSSHSCRSSALRSRRWKSREEGMVPHRVPRHLGSWWHSWPRILPGSENIGPAPSCSPHLGSMLGKDPFIQLQPETAELQAVTRGQN